MFDSELHFTADIFYSLQTLTKGESDGKHCMKGYCHKISSPASKTQNFR